MGFFTNAMNFNKVSSILRDVYMTQPYSQLQALKRATKILIACRERGLPVLVMGSKNKFHFSNKSLMPCLEHVGSQVSAELIMRAASKYGLIICLDPVLYQPILRSSNLPVLIVATARELAENAQIVEIADYIIPQCTTRIDAAVWHLTAKQLNNGK